jgi:hypothetical protein
LWQDYVAPNIKMVDELEMLWKEVVITQLREYIRIRLTGLRKTMKNMVKVGDVLLKFEPSRALLLT